jgi:dienelactone hydrolase
MYPFKYTCTVQRAYVAERKIPVLIAYEGEPRKPLVICQHGFSGNKEGMLGTCLKLATEGFVAAAMDAVKHGERRDPNLLANLGGDPSLMFQVLIGTVEDVRTVIDYLGEVLGADLKTVGMMGVSMGAITTLLAATMEDRLKAAVSVIGGADFGTLVRKSSLGRIGLPVGQMTQFVESAGELIKRYDPIHNVQRFRSMPLLLLNGELDDLIPLECAQSLYEALRPQYQATPERLKMKVYPGVGHEYTHEMEDEAVDWLKRYLLLR